ncbi:MAG TPA: hypothetical protein VEK84_05680, partial [Terriglobales bacterium]|nr:hypothetical protein [Terriglobales bacterium]
VKDLHVAVAGYQIVHRDYSFTARQRRQFGESWSVVRGLGCLPHCVPPPASVGVYFRAGEVAMCGPQRAPK